MINRVLTVCTGNICRSPIAEALLRRHFHGSAITVASAGISALIGYPADPMAQEVAREHELDLTPHRARQLTRDLLVSSDLVLTLDDGHQSWIIQRFPEFRGKVHKFGRWNSNRDIVDPYRQPKAIFEKIYREIEQDSEKWMGRLRPAIPASSSP